MNYLEYFLLTEADEGGIVGDMNSKAKNYYLDMKSIEQVLLERGHTGLELSQRAGCHRTWWCQVMRRGYAGVPMRAATVARIRKALGVGVGRIIKHEEKE